MASICMTQSNFQQHHHLQQQFQLMNGNMLLLQQQQHQPTAYKNSKQQLRITPQPTTPKILGTSHLQNIQPAAAINGSGVGPMLAKKKFGYNPMPYGEPLPSVARRNARERNRVKQVNNGFSNLRQHLPQSVINALSSGGRGASKKLSKVDTLRIAVEYIRGLQDLLDDENENDDCDTKPSTAGPIYLMDDMSNDGYSSVDSPIDCQRFPQLSQNYHSEASASPAPSYTDSDISIGGVNYLQPIALESPQQQQSATAPEAEQPMQFKFEPFDNYVQLGNEDQPDDEELLDYISLWQEQ